MPTKKKPGIGRINIRCEDWFADRVADAAKTTHRSLSEYVRFALAEQMRRDGISAEPPQGVEAGAKEGGAVRRRGRPKKGEGSSSPSGAAGAPNQAKAERRSGSDEGGRRKPQRGRD